jgi:CheY-like chemotaxis protein
MDALLDKRPLVLVVDDDVRSAALLARLLRADGYETEVIVDGAAALARLTRDPVPEALVTDFYLPHADGLAVGRYARSRRAGIPIFVVTGYPHLLDRCAQQPDGMLEVLTKPLDYPDLLRRLVSALGSPKEGEMQDLRPRAPGAHDEPASKPA